jgi:nitrogen fixation NifU-like protein
MRTHSNRPLTNKKALESTYSPTLLDHMHSPRNWGIIDKSDGYGRITGPCGDMMEISLNVKTNRILMCTFDTDGCGATVSCGSVVTEIAIGKTLSQARYIDQRAILDYCGGLPPANKHCATLAAHTLQKAIANYEQMKSTPWKRLYRTER